MARMDFQGIRLRPGPRLSRIASLSGAGAVPGRRRRARLLAHEARELLRLAGPIVIAQLAGIAMNTTDVIMVAPLGPEALASTALATSLHIVFLMACMGTLMGISPLVSQAVGAGDRAETRRVLVQGLWLALLLALPLLAVSFLGTPVALALGQEPALAEAAGAYLRALGPGIVPIALLIAMRQYTDALGLPRVAMVITFVGVGVNVAGNRALIYGVPGWIEPMGAVGSALSTSIVRWTTFLAMAGYIASRADLSPLGRVSLRPVAERIGRIARIGVPVGAQMVAEVGIFSLAAVMMGWLGPVALAAHQVTINLASTTFMVALGTSVAGSIRVGRHIGAGSPRAARRAVVSTYAASLAFMGVCALLFLAAPRFLIGLYTPDAEILRMGTGLLFMAALFQVFDGAQVTGLAVLRGAADTRVPMGITVLGYWAVGLPVAYLLGFHTPMEHLGIWLGLVVSLAVVALLLLWRVRLVIWGRPLVRAVPAPAAEPHALEGPEAVLVAGD